MVEKTHREVKLPTVSARFLADYMAASETGKRTTISSCKYQTLARVFQHDEARAAVGKHIRLGTTDTQHLAEKAEELRNRMADGDFDRAQLDINADFISRFAQVSGGLKLPVADLLPPQEAKAIMIEGVRVNPQLVFRLRRLTRTNRVLVGAGGLRYAKGKPVKDEVANWQCAFIQGYLKETATDQSETPDGKLCVVVDCHTGVCHSASTDAVRRWNQMASACASIAERWPAIKPPKGAVT